MPEYPFLVASMFFLAFQRLRSLNDFNELYERDELGND